MTLDVAMGKLAIERVLRGNAALRPRVRYALAAALTGIALAVRLAILPADGGSEFLTFFPSVLLAAWLFGAGPGVLSVALSAVCVAAWLMPHAGALTGSAHRGLPIVIFILVGLAMCRLVVRPGSVALRTSEQKLRGLFDASPMGIVLTDLDGRFVEFNEAFRALTGYSRDELQRLDPATLTPGNYAAGAGQPDGLLRHTGRYGPVEREIVRKDATSIAVELKGMQFKASDGRTYQYTLVEDIAERSRSTALISRLMREQSEALAALLVSENRLSSVVCAMAEGLVVYAEDGQVIETNPAAEVILGLSSDQLLGKAGIDPGWRAIREDGAPFPDCDHPALVTLRSGRELKNQVMGIHVPHTGLRWISINSQPITLREAAGSAVRHGSVCTFTDITELRAISADLRQSRVDLESILNSVPARITAWNADLTNRFINHCAQQHFGLSAAQARGLHVRELLGRVRYESVRSGMERALAGAQESLDQVEPQSDGSVRYSHVEFVPKQHDGGVVGIYELATDVTELRRSYERIRELAQRLESVREEERRAAAMKLHEGIAQDLFAVRLAVDHVLSLSKGRVLVTDACRELSAAISRCLESTRQVADELRPSALAHLRVADAIDQHARKVGALARLNIEVREIPPFPVLDELTRMLFFRAAQEALVNVERHARAESVKMELRADALHLSMSVDDDGVGITESSQKKAGALGLLGLRERFSAVGGGVTIDARAPRGTRLVVYCPYQVGSENVATCSLAGEQSARILDQ